MKKYKNIILKEIKDPLTICNKLKKDLNFDFVVLGETALYFYTGKLPKNFTILLLNKKLKDNYIFLDNIKINVKYPNREYNYKKIKEHKVLDLKDLLLNIPDKNRIENFKFVIKTLNLQENFLKDINNKKIVNDFRYAYVIKNM